MAEKGAVQDRLVKAIQAAIKAGEPEKALAKIGDLITHAEAVGDLKPEAARKARLDVATQMIAAAALDTPREKVTLSLPQDVLKALRLASAESGEEMSAIVADLLRTGLKKYAHASQALRK